MSIRFNVAVRDTVTYYWQLVGDSTSWIVAGLISEEQAVNGGPTYGIPIRSDVQIYDPSGNFTEDGKQDGPRVSAGYYNTTGAGCPGVAYIRTRFNRGNGLTSYYKVTAGDITIIDGFIQGGSETDSPSPGLPPGGNPDACTELDDGIDGGNT